MSATSKNGLELLIKKIEMIDLDQQIKLIKDLAKSKSLFNKFAIDFANRKNIAKSQLIRFHDFLNKQENKEQYFRDLVEKIMVKYSSNEYKSRFKYYEPKESLFSFLLEYSEKYGKKANDEEFEKYGNYFMACLYKLHDYYFGLMVGQGSCVIIIDSRK